MDARPSILLIEDNMAISKAYKRLFESEGGRVHCAYNADEAIRLLRENPTFSFDLLFTDIDLIGDPKKGADKSGISFACYARRVLPNTPIVGHSAYFDNEDITPEERACFDEWFPKAIKTAERETMFNKALELAKKRIKSRLISDSDYISDEFSDSLSVPNTREEFKQFGYEEDVIEPSDTNGFLNPFTVWRRESEEGCELEVVGCAALLAWGEDKHEAYEHLMDFIEDNKDLADLPNNQLSGSSRQIAEFVRKVTGKPKDNS